MRRAFGEGLMSAGAVTIVMLTLIAIDSRVRAQIVLRFAAHPAQQLSSAGENMRDLTAVVFEAARDRTIDHAPLLIFALVATVLVLFMLRT